MDMEREMLGGGEECGSREENLEAFKERQLEHLFDASIFYVADSVPSPDPSGFLALTRTPPSTTTQNLISMAYEHPEP